MSLKLKDLFEIKFISDKNKENIHQINNLEVHNILNINKNIRKQFILIISTNYKNLPIVNIFKKVLKRDETWSSMMVQYLNSFSISLEGECPKNYNWKLLDNNSIDNNSIDNNILLIDESYERSILTDDYDLFIELKSNFKPLTDNLEKNLETKNWGKKYHFNNISWLIILGNIITNFYGTGLDQIYYRCNNFSKSDFGKVYYINYDNNSVIYRKFIQNRIVCCDSCYENIKINEENYYNYYKYGDMCEQCFKQKKKREIYRLNNIKKLLLNFGKRELFRKSLRETKLFLEKYKMKEPSDIEKYNIMKKINGNMLINKKKKNECSICLEEMVNDIYAGSCGHCFHESCYFKLQSNKCPLCRKTGIFKKLHL